jgi:transcription elongation GreA/GreB family factor
MFKIPPSNIMNKINFYDRICLLPVNEQASEDDELCIQIVPAHEADAVAGRISVDAPVGRAVLHRKMGDTVTIRAQGGMIPMRIVTVEKHCATA